MKLLPLSSPASRRHWTFFAVLLGITIPFLAFVVFAAHTAYRYVYQDDPVELLPQDMRTGIEPFPMGVNLTAEEIVELPNVESYLVNELDGILPEEEEKHMTVMDEVVARLALMDWFQNLAAGEGRILIVQPGERKEQIASNFGKILKWTEDERREFLAMVISEDPVLLEGKFVPGTYVVSQDALPHDVAPLILDSFYTTIVSRYPKDTPSGVPLKDALTVASLIEREAYDFTDMRYISGVIWNRLFIDMNLQIDATLQYAKGTHSSKSWWPKPVPNDKYIDSLYNTYENSGLPPTPIANPSIEAVLAALNPRITDCYYYFHDSDGGFHCSPTYEEHVAMLKQHYGRGK